MKASRLVRIVAISFIMAVIATAAHVLMSIESSSDEVLAYPRFPDVGSPEVLAYSSVRAADVVPQGLPKRLKIPAIAVDALIEDAFVTPEGRMDVPSGFRNVAWYAAGTQPGQIGSAVIGGHYAFFKDNKGKSVFYELDSLKAGDMVYVEDDRGDVTAFRVRAVQLFDRDADATAVFTSRDGRAHLNLITCEGIWNSVDDTYPERRVVFTDAVEDFNGVISGPKSTATFHRTLGMGSRGADVVTLQNFLEQKGFLIMPAGTTKGYFGQVTREAMAKYQTSVGLPSVGVLGPLTRVKLISELGSGE
jgi:LPXTG-site transpeptidase (sortase) family protein